MKPSRWMDVTTHTRKQLVQEFLTVVDIPYKSKVPLLLYGLTPHKAHMLKTNLQLFVAYLFMYVSSFNGHRTLKHRREDAALRIWEGWIASTMVLNWPCSLK